jgi:hypothetical protein
MRRVAHAAALLAALTLACGEQKPASAPRPPAEATVPAPAPVIVAPSPTQAPGATAAPPSSPAPTLAPAKPAAPPPSPPAPTQAAGATAAPPSGPAPILAPPRPAAAPIPTPAPAAAPAASLAHAKVGADKCKGCHRLQYDSWAASPHKAKDLDCEGCHGNGADYRSAGVMKDRAAAVAAGLVMPGPDFCRRCHAKADTALLPKAHAHKVK